MEIDHIFIFCQDQGQVADELVKLGLTEGSNRIHAGQGTVNRNFYFENFFLEILWVHDQIEFSDPRVVSTGLYQRSQFLQNGCSRFGLCLVNPSETDPEVEAVFKQAIKYQPHYFSEGITIDVINNEDYPGLPWTFKLPFKGQKKWQAESTSHSAGMRRLTTARFEYRGGEDPEFLESFKNQDRIILESSDRNWLTLVFENQEQGKIAVIEPLNLTLKF